MKQLTWICLTAPLFALAVNFADPQLTRANPAGIPAPSAAPALPAPRPGLWQEISTTVDGVNVRKVRDTTGGDYVVCYIASRQVVPNPYDLTAAPAMLAISCVPEKRP